jgi:peptidoglycan/xylan/chitin deacetylase (PgdA/CDA1 family)
LGRVRTLVRDTLGTLLSAIGMTDLSRRQAGRLLVVTFHRVLPQALREKYPFPGLAVTPEELSWFLAFLKDHAPPAPLAPAFESWQNAPAGNAPTIAVTFDDAQWDNYEYARPVLQHHGIKATFYAPVNAVGTEQSLWHDRLGFAVRELLGKGEEHQLKEALSDRELPCLPHLDSDSVTQAAKTLPPEQRHNLVEALVRATGTTTCPEWNRLMNWEELKTLAQDGHEIGSHGLSHELLPQCTEQVLTREVVESKSRIEERLGRDVLSFCYPNGDVDDRTEGAVRTAGYKAAVSTRWGTNSTATSPWSLRRCDINSAHFVDRHGTLSRSRAALRLSGLQPGL